MSDSNKLPSNEKSKSLKSTKIISMNNEKEDNEEEEEGDSPQKDRDEEEEEEGEITTTSDRTMVPIGSQGYSLPTGVFVNNQNTVMYYPKPFYCEVCSKYFGTKGSLKTHLRVHTGEKPFICPVPNCGRSFTQQANCSRHIKLMHHDKNVKLRPQRRQDDGTLKDSGRNGSDEEGEDEELTSGTTSTTPKANKTTASIPKGTSTNSSEKRIKKKNKVEIIAPDLIPSSAQQLPPQAYYQQISPPSMPFPPQTSHHSQFLYSQPAYDSTGFLTVYHHPIYSQQQTTAAIINEAAPATDANYLIGAPTYPVIAPPPLITTPPPLELNGAMKCLMKLCEEEREKTIISAQHTYYPSKQ